MTALTDILRYELDKLRAEQIATIDGLAQRIIKVTEERDAARARITQLERLLRAALAQNRTWYSDEAAEAVELLEVERDEH